MDVVTIKQEYVQWLTSILFCQCVVNLTWIYVKNIKCVHQEWKEEMERLAKQLKDIQGAREEDVVRIAEFDVSTEAALCVCVWRMVNISREAALTFEGVNQLEHGLTD